MEKKVKGGFSISGDLEVEIKNFIKVLSETEFNQENLTNASSFSFFGNNEEGFLILCDDDSTNYLRIRSLLIEKICSSNLINEKTIDNGLNNLILETLDMKGKRKEKGFNDRFNDGIKKFRSLLASGVKKYEVFYPVLGILKEELPFTFGKIQLLDIEIALQNEIREQEDFFRVLPEKGKYFTCSYARVIVEAFDEEAACELAKKIIRNHLNALNYFSELFLRSYGYAYLPGESESTTILRISSIDNGIARRNLSLIATGPFPLSLKAIKGVNKTVLDYFDSFTESMNDFQEGLFTSIQWAGKASLQLYLGMREDAFLSYMICLETLLLPQDTNDLTFRLEQRIALLLSKKDSPIDKKKAIFNRIKGLYNIRSNIVHNGSFEVGSADLSYLRWVVHNIIIRFLTDERFSQIKSKQELENVLSFSIIN